LEEQRVGGAPCNCADIVYFVDLSLGSSPTHCYAMSPLGGFITALQPYRTHLGPSDAYILTIPSMIERHDELNAPMGSWQFVMLGLTLSPNVVGCLHPQLEPHKRRTEAHISGHGSPNQAGGYCCSHFLTLPPEPVDVHVLYLAGGCESADMKLGRCMGYETEKKGKDVHGMESKRLSNWPHMVYIINSWHLNTYFWSWTSEPESKYSTPIRPLTNPIA